MDAAARGFDNALVRESMLTAEDFLNADDVLISGNSKVAPVVQLDARIHGKARSPARRWILSMDWAHGRSGGED